MFEIGGNTKGSKHALVRVVWSQASRRQYSIEIRDQMCQEMWMVEWLLWTSHTISFCVVTPRDLRRKRNIWRLLKNRCGIRDTSQVFATRGGRSQQTRSSERRIGAMVVLESNVEDVQCSLERCLHSCHFRCQGKRL